MNISLLGIDIAKTNFQLHGVNQRGKAVFKKRLTREKLLPFIAELAPCEIVMEACSGANYWAREFTARGHQVKLISPQYVKPFVKTNKTDAKDAEAICEAASRPSMNFVTPKTIEQQDIQGIHRIRERLIGNRTALVNQIRGLLAEYGIVVAKGIGHIRSGLPTFIEQAEGLTARAKHLFLSLHEELKEIDEKIKARDKELEIIFSEYEVCERLAEIEGIGVIGATACIAAVGNAHAFKNGRQLAAWLGLTPREHSSGNRHLLLGISKRGDCYLRKILVHGARSVVYRSMDKTDKWSLWIQGLVSRAGKNKASVALANKNARIIWALLTQGTCYQKAA